MESYSVKAMLSASDHGFTTVMNRAEKTLAGIEVGAQKTSGRLLKTSAAFAVANKAVSVFANVLKSSLSSAIDRVDTMNRFPKVMEQIGFSADKSKASIQKLSKGIEGLPTALNDITASTQKLALLTENLEKATDTSLALNDAFYASGASSEDASRGILQYTQMLSKGAVDIQSWRTLQETMGVALNELAESFGYAGESAQNDLYDALKGGEITFNQLNDRLIELDTSVGGFAERAKTASGGIATSFTNLGTSVVRGIANVISAADTSLAENGFLTFQEQIEKAKEGVDTAFNAMTERVDGFITTFGPAVKFAADNMDVLTATLAPAAAGFVLFKAADTAAESIRKFNEKKTEAGKTLKELHEALKLSAQATELEAEATRLSTQATAADEAAKHKSALAASLDAKARDLENEATKAVTAAKELEAKATKAQTAAERAADTAKKSRKKADEASARAIKTKEKAERDAAKASQLAANADKLSVPASKARANADKASARASEARAKSDKAAAIASKANTAATSANAAAEAANTAATGANAAALTVSNAAVTAKTLLLGILSGELGIVTAAQTAWNIAMTANPIGTLIAAATVLTTVVIGVSKVLGKLCDCEDTVAGKTKKLSESIEEHIKASKESKKAYEEELSNVNTSASATEKLADKVITLSKVENKSAAQKSELQGYIKKLNGSMDDLNLQYDEENDKLNMGVEALKKKAEAYKEQKKAEIYMERYNKLLEEQVKNDEKLAEAQKLYTDTQKRLNKEMEYSDGAFGYYNTQLMEQDKNIAKLQKTKEDYVRQEEEITKLISDTQAEQTKAVQEAQAAQEAALAESIANQTVSMDQLSEANQKTVQDLRDSWQDYYDASSDMFDKLSDKQTMSVDEMIANLQENQRIVSQMGTNMENLRNRFDNLGLSEGLLDNLAQMGPEAAGYVAALVTSSDEKLTELATSFSQGGANATDGFLKSSGLNNGEITAAIGSMVTQIETSLRERVLNTDWSSITGNMCSELSGGFTENSGQVTDAGKKVMTDTRDAMGAAAGEGSPCTSYIELGNNMVAGLALGLGESSVATTAAVTMADSVMRSVERAFASADFSGIGRTAFSGIASAAKKGMGDVSSAITTAMKSSNAAVENGMSRMKSATLSNMQSIARTVSEKMIAVKNDTTDGIRRMNTAISSGMNTANKVASSGINAVLASFNTLNSRLYAIGVYSMEGFRNGLLAGALAVYDAATKIANNVENRISRALDIGSPSRVLMKIGAFATEGLAIGMVKQLSLVEKASDRLAEVMTPVTAPDFTGTRMRYSFAGYGDMEIRCNDELDDGNILSELRGIRGKLDELNNRTYYIETHVDMDGREVARGAAAYTQEELDRLEKINNRKRGYR